MSLSSAPIYTCMVTNELTRTQMARRLGEYCFICARNIVLKSASLIMSMYLIRIIHIIILYIININNIYSVPVYNILIHVVYKCHWLTQDKNPIHACISPIYIVFTKSNFIQPTSHYVCL